MTGRDHAVWLARSEVTARTLASTEQILGVHSLAAEPGGAPSVARVDEAREPGAYYVYFSVANEPYYCVVVVAPDQADALSVRAVYVEAGVRVYLGIYSDQLRPDDITARIGLEPTETHERGQPISRQGTRTYRHHVWQLESHTEMPGGVEEKLAALLECLEPAASRIAGLRPACDVQVGIVFKGWGGNPQFGGFQFDVEVTRLLAALGAELDFDLYAYGPPMFEDVPSSRPAT